MSPSLSVVADNDLHTATAAAAAAPTTKTETVAERVRRLQAEAKELARDHIRSLSEAMLGVEKMAAEIAEGGDAYPVGAREMSRRLQEEAATQAMSLAAINERALN